MKKSNIIQMHGRKKSTPDQESEVNKKLYETLEKNMNDFDGTKADFLCMLADFLDVQAGYDS